MKINFLTLITVFILSSLVVSRIIFDSCETKGESNLLFGTIICAPEVQLNVK